MAQDFSIGNALSVGWNKMKENFLLLLYVILTAIGLQIIMILGERTPIEGIIVVLAIAAWLVLRLGAYCIALNITDGRPAEYKMLWSKVDLFPDFLIGTVLYALIVIGGLILLIVPGIIWALKYQFYGYYIVDKRMGPIDAIKASGKVTHGHKWNLFLLWLAVIGVNIVGALALLVGLFATIPATELAMAWTYRTLDAANPQGAKRAAKGAPARQAPAAPVKAAPKRAARKAKR